MQLPNPRNVIPDVCIALLPFIMDLVHFDSVAEFLQSTPMDGKFHRRSLSEWHSSRVEQYSSRGVHELGSVGHVHFMFYWHLVLFYGPSERFE